MSDIAAEHGQLLQFLYAAPVGLVHARLDGTVETINGAAARFLLPLAPDGRLDNLYAALRTAVPGLAESVAAHAGGTVVDARHVEVLPPPPSRAPAMTLSVTVNRLSDARVIAVITDVTGQARQDRALAEREAHDGDGARMAVASSLTGIAHPQRLVEALAQHCDQLEATVAERTRQLEASNASLVAQQALLRTVADAVPGLVGHWDAGLRCRFANAGHAAWFGRRADEIAGLTLPELLGPALFARLQPQVDAVLRGQAQHFQCPMPRPDGSWRHTLVACIPHAERGQVRGFNMVVSDVTDLKQAGLRLSAADDALARRAAEGDDASRAKGVARPGPAPDVGGSEQRLRVERAGQQVLLVEDNPVNREVGVLLLEAVGLRVDTADDGAQAVAKVAAQPYALVLMDVQMPGTDGLWATRRIRALGGGPSGPGLPILALTANASVDDRQACLDAGMNDHVAKPIDAQQLYDALWRWLPASAG